MRIAVFMIVGLLAGCKTELGDGTIRAVETSSDQTRVEQSALEKQDVGTWAAGGLMVTAADLNGDGRLEWVVATAQELRVVSADGKRLATVPLDGGIQVLETAKINGKSVLLVGTGLTIARRKALGRLAVFRLKDGVLEEDLIFQMDPAEERHEIVTAQQRADGSLLIAHYESQFMVKAQTVRWSDKGEESWTFEPIGAFRMATTWALGDADNDGKEDILVGRVYGDEGVSDGDAFLLRPDGSRVVVPTRRGVRALWVHDVDGDGKNEVYLGDGWHHKYQAEAEPLITRAKFANGVFEAELLHTLADDVEFTVWDIFGGVKGTFYARSNAALYEVSASGPKAVAAAAADVVVGHQGKVLVVGPVPQIR